MLPRLSHPAGLIRDARQAGWGNASRTGPRGSPCKAGSSVPLKGGGDGRGHRLPAGFPPLPELRRSQPGKNSSQDGRAGQQGGHGRQNRQQRAEEADPGAGEGRGGGRHPRGAGLAAGMRAGGDSPARSRDAGLLAGAGTAFPGCGSRALRIPSVPGVPADGGFGPPAETWHRERPGAPAARSCGSADAYCFSRTRPSPCGTCAVPALWEQLCALLNA